MNGQSSKWEKIVSIIIGPLGNIWKKYPSNDIRLIEDMG